MEYFVTIENKLYKFEELCREGIMQVKILIADFWFYASAGFGV